MHGSRVTGSAGGYAGTLQRRQERGADWYLQRAPIPGCPSFYDMGQPQVFKAEVVDGYKGTGNLTADSSSETNSNSPWLVFTVKSTRPRSDAVRAVFLKLGELPSNEPAKSAPAARRKLDSRQTDDPCHLSALKVESDKCVSMHTMAVPFAEVEKCGNFKVNNGTLMPGYTLYQTQGYLTWSDIIIAQPGNTTTTTYLSTFPLTFRRGIPGLFTPDTPIDDPSALLPPPPPEKPIGLIAGVIGGVLGLIAIALLAFFYVRRQRAQKRAVEAIGSAYLDFLNPDNEPTKPSPSFSSNKSKDIEVDIIALDSTLHSTSSFSLAKSPSHVSFKGAKVTGILVQTEKGLALITTKSGVMPISDLYGNGMDSPSELKMMPSVASFASHQLQHQPSSAALIPKFEVQDLSTPSEITLPEFAPTRKSVFWGPELDTIVGGSKSANRKSLFVPEPQTKRLSQLITPEEAELVVFDEEGHEIKVEITGDEVVEGFVVSEPSN